NNLISVSRSGAATAAVSLLLQAAIAFAADPPSQAVPPSPPTAPAQPDNPGRTRGPGGNNQGPRGNFVGGLNLDDKQRELLREATQKESDELRKLNDKLQAAQKELVQSVV